MEQEGVLRFLFGGFALGRLQNYWCGSCNAVTRHRGAGKNRTITLQAACAELVDASWKKLDGGPFLDIGSTHRLQTQKSRTKPEDDLPGSRRRPQSRRGKKMIDNFVVPL